MPEEDIFSVDSIVNQQPDSPGAKLVAARYEYDLSQGEVAGYLNLSESVIAALEKDEYQQLPGPTFVKGYLRSYARLLNLDEEEIVGKMGDAPKNRLNVPSSSSGGRHRVKIRQRRKPRLGWLVVIMLLVAAAGWFLVANPNFRIAESFENFSFPFFGDDKEQSEEISFPKASSETSGQQPQELGNALLQKEGQ